MTRRTDPATWMATLPHRAAAWLAHRTLRTHSAPVPVPRAGQRGVVARLALPPRCPENSLGRSPLPASWHAGVFMRDDVL